MKTVIIGGVAGGAGTAARLRRLDESMEIVMLERGKYISYANCGLPYYLGKVIPSRKSLLVMTPERFNARFQIDVRTEKEVIAIDRTARTVTVRRLADGTEYREPYDRLVIATGSSPLPVDIPGADLPAVRHLWTLADMDRIAADLDHQAKRAVVIGGGFVGIELAENLKERGLDTVLIHRSKQLMPTLDAEMGSLLVTELRNLGIDVQLENEVASFERTDSGALRLNLKNGSTLETDLAVLCIGVKPNSELARQAGLELGKRGHIITDEHLRTSDPDIFAVGDVIEVNDPILDVNTAIALAGPANRQARIAADNIAGRPSAYRGTLGTSVIKVGQLTAGSVGYTERRLAGTEVKYHKIYLHPASNASYYPGGAPLHIKLLFDHQGKILGAQLAGTKGADKRLDVIATAMRNGVTAPDLFYQELGYAPPYGSAKDPVNLAGMIAENVLNGDSRVIHFDAIPPNAFLLDVRETAENELGALPDTLNIPLAQLRANLDKLPKDRLIAIYCQSGLRGYVAERILRQHGFDAANLSGGWLTWKLFHPTPVPVASKSQPATPACPLLQSTAVPEKTIDVRALQCPGPVVTLKQELDAQAPGNTVELLAAASFAPDLKSWIASSGNELLDLQINSGELKAQIRKKATDPASAVPTAAHGHSAAIVLFSNDLDKAMAAMIIACGMAASGAKVGIFFTFWGLSVLRKNPAPPVKKDFMSRMFGWMLPKGAAKLNLSQMNMGSMGAMMMRRTMAAKNVTSLPDLINQARSLGVKFIACEMAMNVMGITREELIDIDEVAGVAAFVALAKESNNTLFI